jgi:hypothetical protein
MLLVANTEKVDISGVDWDWAAGTRQMTKRVRSQKVFLDMALLPVGFYSKKINQYSSSVGYY